MNFLASDECLTAIKYSLPISSSLITNNKKEEEKEKEKKKEEKKNDIPLVQSEVEKYSFLEEVSYGAVSSNLEGSGPEKYYLTTAIAYTNGYPHMGHAYEVKKKKSDISSLLPF